jgi:hypothetical protein
MKIPYHSRPWYFFNGLALLLGIPLFILGLPLVFYLPSKLLIENQLFGCTEMTLKNGAGCNVEIVEFFIAISHFAVFIFFQAPIVWIAAMLAFICFWRIGREMDS